MKLILKVTIILVISLLIISSVYVIFFDVEEDKNGVVDNEPPTINPSTGNTTGTSGKITTISVTFSDNVNVTKAIMYYRSASADSWSNTSILSGTADIVIPSDSVEDWYYYVTVDDAAGNGPVGNPSSDGSIYYTIDVKRDIENLVHTVFIEEGTATWCESCPVVAEILHELYDSGEYSFYYVSMVEDGNDEKGFCHSDL